MLQLVNWLNRIFYWQKFPPLLCILITSIKHNLLGVKTVLEIPAYHCCDDLKASMVYEGIKIASSKGFYFQLRSS